MKKSTTLLLSLILFVFQWSYSQEMTGIASYKSFVKLDMKMDSTQVSAEMLDQLKQMLREQSQKDYELQFNKNESLFKEKEKLNKPGSMFGNSVVSTYGAIEAIYQNLKDKQEIRKSDILGKTFLVTGSMKSNDWILEKETKNIGEYVCFKATYRIPRLGSEIEKGETLDHPSELEYDEIVAWYTPQIPMSFGPMGNGGLPGLILEINTGVVTYLCNQVILNPKKGVTISPPTNGKRVSHEEFEEIRDQKLQEMNEQHNFPGDKTIEIKIGG